MRHVRRGGAYFRIADADWKDPLDGSYSLRTGGRWNPVGSFPVAYLNRDIRVAKANVVRKFAGRPYGPEILQPDEGPALISTSVVEDDYVDVVTDEGCVAVGLARTYPMDRDGNLVKWGDCQAIGTAAWDAGEPGIAARSATVAAPATGEELAWFARPGRARLRQTARSRFDEWFW